MQFWDNPRPVSLYVAVHQVDITFYRVEAKYTQLPLDATCTYSHWYWSNNPLLFVNNTDENVSYSRRVLITICKFCMDILLLFTSAFLLSDISCKFCYYLHISETFRQIFIFWSLEFILLALRNYISIRCRSYKYYWRIGREEIAELFIVIKSKLDIRWQGLQILPLCGAEVLLNKCDQRSYVIGYSNKQPQRFILLPLHYIEKEMK